MLLETLLQQFSEQFSFLRETLDNSLRAGSARVEINTFYNEPDCEIRIEDWGAGIPLEVLEKRILPEMRGEWPCGLGLLSCFALAPQRVLVASSNFQVEFRYRDYTIEHHLSHLPELRSGTLIRWFKAISPGGFSNYREMIGRCLHHWVRTPQAQVWLDGADLRRTPEEHPYCCRLERPDLSLRVWPSLDDCPPQSWLRRGLLLSEVEQPTLLPGVAFCADSPDLSVALTRDRVIQDEVYEKVLCELRGLIKQRLLPQLVAQGQSAYLRHYPKLCRLPLLSGRSIRLDQLGWCRRLWGQIYWDRESSEQAQKLMQRGIPVLRDLKPWYQEVLGDLSQVNCSEPPADQGIRERIMRIYSRWAWQ